MDFPGGSDGKASAYNASDLGLIPGLGRSAGKGNSNPLQYSWEKAMASHSTTLAWKIPWMEEPGRLQSMESQGQGSLVGCRLWGHVESDMTEAT